MLPAGTAARESAPGRYLVSGDIGPDLVAAVTAWCASRGVLPGSLDVGTRTLEDVYLQLTAEPST